MERKQEETEVRTKSKYRKDGGGSLRLRREGKRSRIIKPGQVFYAYPEEISKAFSDTVILLDGVEEAPPAALDVVESPYELRHRGGGYYDIYDPLNDKNLNESAIKGKAEAEKVLASL